MMLPIRKCISAVKFKELSNGTIMPTYPSDPEGVEMNLFEVEPSKLRAPDVTIDDLYAALSKIKPSVAKKDL